METHTQPGHDGDEHDPDSTHAMLNFMLCHWMPRLINPQAAAQTQLRIAWEFIGEGGGTWTMEIAAGQTTVREERAPDPDLTFTQTAETFFKTLHLWHDPMIAMLTGEIKVQGFEHMRELNELFPDPRPDPVIEPPP